MAGAHLFLFRSPPTLLPTYLVFGGLFLDNLGCQLEACGFLYTGADSSKLAAGEKSWGERGLLSSGLGGGSYAL